MTKYRVHTIESAPEKSKSALRGLEQSLGLIPNLAASMAESPTLVNGFVGAFGNFHGGSFNGAEKQALLLTNAVANRCEWAVAFHSTMALKEGLPTADVQAIRQGRLPRERRLAALVAFDRALIERRGHVGDEEIAAIRDAGFSADQILEMIAGLAVSVMANYAGNVTRPPLEERFQGQAWAG